MAHTCVWCLTWRDLLVRISDRLRLQSRSLGTLCKGRSLVCWRNLRNCTSAASSMVVRIVYPSTFENPLIYMPNMTKTAITASNIVSDIDTRRECLEPDLAKEPPCTIDRKIIVDDVEYPVVHSRSVPGYVEWDADWGHVNRNVMVLINLGHCMFSNFKF